MNSPPVALAADGISKGFGAGARRMPILRGVSLRVSVGQTVFLVGPSGSGKSTLLSILGCLLRSDSGRAHVLGTDVAALDEPALTAFRGRHIGFVFQNFNLFPTLSALDNLCLTLAMRGTPAAAARRRAVELLDWVCLGRRAHLRPAQLSTGECQRVAVARALTGDPDILCADEPTASLDAENGQVVMHLLSDLFRNRGRTLIVVTHDYRIYPFADRIVRLEDGCLTEEWTPPRREPAGGRIAAPNGQSRLQPVSNSRGRP